MSQSRSDQTFLLAVVTAVVASSILTSTNAASIPAGIQKRPNIIVIQPDDHLFLEEWTPPGRFEHGTSAPTSISTSDEEGEQTYISPVPNINRIRHQGLEMTNAYAASTMCGTSRYSTLTGRLPSRSSYGRQIDQNSWNSFSGGNDDDWYSTYLREVVIPKTKLEDSWGVEDGNDCTANNLAAILKSNGYSTGVVGKWHLEDTQRETGSLYNNYPRVQDKVRNCGFDFAEAIYRENLGGEYNVDGGFVTHNMEHLTSEAIRFIQDSVGANDKKDKKEKDAEEIEKEDKPFFLYFNPTVPHDSGDVTDALRNADCKDTVQGRLGEAPYIPHGMTADFKERDGCYEYRQSVLDRAAASEASMDRDKLAGAVWVDDAIGSLFATLEAMEILDNTLILFQLDHGMDAKGSLFEGGSRIVQFIHYPDQIKVDQSQGEDQGWKFDGLVSTIDIAPTLMDLAGVPLAPTDNDSAVHTNQRHRYDMDGKSWFSEVLAANSPTNMINQKQERQQKSFYTNNYFQDRCLFTEEGLDRSVRCGCYKYIYLSNPNSGFTVREANKEGVKLDNDNFYNLCDEDTGNYVNSPQESPELWARYFDSRISNDMKSKLKSKIACLVKQTDPSNAFPDYETDCGLPLNGLVSGPSVIEVVKRDPESPEEPGFIQPEDVVSDLEPKEPVLTTPAASSSMANTMPKYAIAMIILILLMVPCFFYWIYRQVCRRYVLGDSYRSKVAPIAVIGINSKNGDSQELTEEIETSMLESAVGRKGNHLVAGSTTIQKTGHEVAHNYGMDYSRSSNPSIWRRLADGFMRQANLREKWGVYTVSGVVVGTSSGTSVATDVTTDSSEAMNSSSVFDSYQPSSDDESVEGRPHNNPNGDSSSSGERESRDKGSNNSGGCDGVEFEEV